MALLLLTLHLDLYISFYQSLSLSLSTSLSPCTCIESAMTAGRGGMHTWGFTRA